MGKKVFNYIKDVIKYARKRLCKYFPHRYRRDSEQPSDQFSNFTCVRCGSGKSVFDRGWSIPITITDVTDLSDNQIESIMAGKEAHG